MSDWPSDAAGAAEAWTHIDTQVLGGAAAAITFSGIAAAAAPRLRVYAYIIQSGASDSTLLRLNNDGGANYRWQYIRADGAVPIVFRAAAQTEITISLELPLSANDPSLMIVEVFKPVAGEVARVTVRSAVTNTTIKGGPTSGEWTNTGALINRLDVFTASNFAAGTRVVLEGAA